MRYKIQVIDTRSYVLTVEASSQEEAFKAAEQDFAATPVADLHKIIDKANSGIDCELVSSEPIWELSDQEKALNQGWGLFGEDYYWVLGREVDVLPGEDRPRFATDEAAFQHVMDLSAAGNALAAHAVSVLMCNRTEPLLHPVNHGRKIILRRPIGQIASVAAVSLEGVRLSYEDVQQGSYAHCQPEDFLYHVRVPQGIVKISGADVADLVRVERG